MQQHHIDALKAGQLSFPDFLRQGLLEYLDVNEENTAHIALYESHCCAITTHLEIEPFTIMGVVSGEGRGCWGSRGCCAVLYTAVMCYARCRAVLGCAMHCSGRRTPARCVIVSHQEGSAQVQLIIAPSNHHNLTTHTDLALCTSLPHMPVH